MSIALIAMTSCTKQTQEADDFIQQNKTVEDNQKGGGRNNVMSVPSADLLHLAAAN